MESSNKYVLYLFGAGASAQTVPVAKQMPKDVESTAQRLEEWYTGRELQEGVAARAEVVRNDLWALAGDFREYRNEEQSASGGAAQDSTLDMYMHILKKNGREEKYQKRKNTLAIYVLLRQMFIVSEHAKMDERYGDWLEKIAPSKDPADFGNSIRVLTWNYDMQMEFAYYRHFRFASEFSGVSARCALHFLGSFSSG